MILWQLAIVFDSWVKMAVFIVNGSRIVYKYDQHNLYPKEHLLLPILVSLQVLAFEEDEEIFEIKLQVSKQVLD